MNRLTIAEAVRSLLDGGNVAFPTETVYGLGGNACNAEAVAGIFRAKGRPSDNPLIVHVDSAESLNRWIRHVLPVERAMMDAFWPGPLTIVLPVERGVFADAVTAGLDTVGIRVPAHPLALELLNKSGLPLAAPSANRSGKPSPTCAAHVIHDLDGKIAGVLDGGACEVGLESTVVRVVSDAVHILRPGAVTAEQIRSVAAGWGLTVLEAAEIRQNTLQLEEAAAPRSPGMKYPHYAPDGETVAFQLNLHNLEATGRFIEALQSDIATDKTIAVIAFSETIHTIDQAGGWLENVIRLDLGGKTDVAEAMKRIYSHLRACDQAGAEKVWIECDPDMAHTGGQAYLNRVNKAAAGRQIRFT